MSETRSHKQAKKKAAGKKGKTEVLLPSGKRLDAQTHAKATEIQRSATGLEAAAKRLKESEAKQKVLTVPQPLMPAARKAMRQVGVSGTVRNISGTKRSSVSR